MTDKELKALGGLRVRLTLTNGTKNISIQVELGLVEKFYGGGLGWTVGLPFEAVYKQLQKRGFKIKKVKILEDK